MLTDRLARQVAFLLEADKLKSIIRRTPIADNSRLENSAEHSWHLALAAMALEEYAPAGTELTRVIRMLVVHDLVEVDAGDTFAYDLTAQDSKADRERLAADRLFGLLPPDQAPEFRALWEEFEAQDTPSARFANALDRFQPLLLNMESGGGSWVHHGVPRDQVMRRMAPVREWMPHCWPYVQSVIDRACAAGLIRE